MFYIKYLYDNKSRLTDYTVIKVYTDIFSYLFDYNIIIMRCMTIFRYMRVKKKNRK